MKVEVLQAQVDKAVEQMYEQTGLVPGGPTGLCLPYVVSAVGGQEIDYQRRLHELGEPSFIGRNSFYEYPSDLSVDGVWVQEHFPKLIALSQLLTQIEIPIDGVLVEGMILNQPEGHIIAVIKDDEQKGMYHIVDSLMRGGLSTNLSTEEVVAYSSHIFDTTTLSLQSIATLEEDARRRRASSSGASFHRRFISDTVAILIPNYTLPFNEIVFRLP